MNQGRPLSSIFEEVGRVEDWKWKAREREKMKRSKLGAVAKEARCAHIWIEVAPAPFISLNRKSNIPRLETIAEEAAELEDNSK